MSCLVDHVSLKYTTSFKQMYIYILQHLTIFWVAAPLGITRTSYRHLSGRKWTLNYTCFQTIYVIKPSIKDTR